MNAAGPRIAGAPISWGVCEAPGWGTQLDADQVFGELAAAGFDAVEAGPDGYLPGDGEATRAALRRHGLVLAGAFLPVALHTPEHRATSLATLETVLDRLAASPGAALSLAVMGDRGDFAEREELTSGGWSSTLAALDEIAVRAAERAVPCGVHSHAGTAVERGEDLARILDGSDVGITVDTGHMVLGGIDPVQVVRDAGDRIVHVHLKDVDMEQSSAWRDGRFATYRAAVDAGLYTSLGEGGAGVADAVQVLAAGGYGGWLVVERDTSIDEQEPTTPNARIAAGMRERAWVERCVAGVASGQAG